MGAENLASPGKVGGGGREALPSSNEIRIFTLNKRYYLGHALFSKCRLNDARGMVPTIYFEVSNPLACDTKNEARNNWTLFRASGVPSIET